MTNLGAWDEHYGDMAYPLAYGKSSYPIIAADVAGCDVVEDWGCGGGALRAYLDPAQTYVGIDGSHTPYTSVLADLVDYRSSACAVVLRHVLEHNNGWRDVLANAVASFTDRLIIVLFTPLSEETHIMFREREYGMVPVISFNLDELLAEIPASPVLQYTVERELPSPDTAFGVETFIRAWRH